MIISNLWRSSIHSGISADHAHTFNDKLIARNKLSFLCAVFSLLYVVYFLFNSLYLPLAGISFGIIFFISSISLNRYQWYTLSSALTLLNTNYCVLFFSTYLGFDSGIHLYLFTSPLIVLTLFDTKKSWIISLSMLSYIINFIIILIIGKYYKYSVLPVSSGVLDKFYTVNFACSILILFILSLYFLYNNNKINRLLTVKNIELEEQQRLLSKENRIRREAESDARESLAQREVLLSEIHHRVKNNLAVINGLMELQSVYIKDPNTIGVIKESQNRIKSLAILHEKLYENKTLKEVEMRSFVEQLLEHVKISFSTKEKNISFITSIAIINLDMKQAMPLSLLINELISNSYKHAFHEKERGQISIGLMKENNAYTFQYSDDGPGFEYSESTERNSLGLNLIEIFSQQLNGVFNFQQNKPGMEFTLRFN
ncbi:MAG: sensor histidine kinase [Bacteroidetes bacterium]|nr:sensor histidine kinase [Bacteroidota bacterium]